MNTDLTRLTKDKLIEMMRMIKLDIEYIQYQRKMWALGAGNYISPNELFKKKKEFGLLTKHLKKFYDIQSI